MSSSEAASNPSTEAARGTGSKIKGAGQSKNRSGRGGRGQHRSRSSSRGGGRGRGNGRGHSNKNKNKYKSISRRPLQQYTSDFLSMHSECRAARYKVHAPGCDCSKIKTIRERASEHITENGHALDGLVVLPDIKSINSLYLCLDTVNDVFRFNPKESELKLRHELFVINESFAGYNDGGQSYKVSCAQCLLEDNPNGFVCVSSPSIQTVEIAKDLAMKRIRYKMAENIPLHSDHSKYLCVISRNILWQCETTKTRDQTKKADYTLRHSLSKQGFENIGRDDTFACCEIELGHHLSSLLHITKADADANSTYWLVMLQWTGTKYKVDLPGGKRHLGETSFEAAIRECEEECSLEINDAWVHGEPRRGKRKADENNVYYMLRPPTDLMMTSLESNLFWHQEGFCKDPVG
mmetsp:Transcript_12309/g.18891  ORF Transcript_12309/g.18891 Transcript_12309/m.18891 type:complete len:408 (-) Transcript_12309:235-1458(-)